MRVAYWQAPGVDGFFGEYAQQEVALLVGLERGRHDAVGAGSELVAPGHLAHVDELRRLGDRRVVLEEVQVQRTAVRVFQLRHDTTGCVQPRPSADNKALPALTADSPAAAPLLLSAPAAVDRYLPASRRSAANPPATAGQTDGRTLALEMASPGNRHCAKLYWHTLVTRFLGKLTVSATDQSCPWVGLTDGLGWVEFGRDFQFLVGWVGSTMAKVLKFERIMLTHLKHG